MEKMTQKEIKRFVKYGHAIDITYDDSMVDEPLTKITYSCGIYGINGALYKGDKSGKTYAITSRATNIFKY